MISYVSGRVISATNGIIVIDCGGIGYELLCSTDAIVKLGKVGETVKIPAYLHVYEDGMSLFGFADEEEKSLFNKLITVSSIGPKTAIGMLSAGAETLINAVVSQDAVALSKIKGVGKKTAERIIVELKDKLGGFAVKKLGVEIENIETDDEAVEALVSLGYTRSEATSAVIKAVGGRQGLSTEQIIMLVLKG